MRSSEHKTIMDEFRKDVERFQASTVPIVAATRLPPHRPTRSTADTEQVARMLIPKVEHGVASGDAHIANVTAALQRYRDAAAVGTSAGQSSRRG